MADESQDRVRPFRVVSEYMYWLSRNCDYCARAYDRNDETYLCESERALDEAQLDGGLVPVAVARRLGAGTTWKCLDYERFGGDEAVEAPRAADLPGQGMLF